MGEFTRKHNWSATPLNTPSAWPQSLQTALSIVLNSNVPMILLWGDENISFFNDAYLMISELPGVFEGHIGKPAAKLWPQDWDNLTALLHKVKTEVEVIEDVMSLQSKHNILFTARFTPIVGEGNSAEGVLMTYFETTSKNHQDTEIKIKNQFQLTESEMHLQLLRDTVPAMIFYLDDRQRYQSYNRVFSEWFGVGRPDAIGKTVQEFLGDAAYEKTRPHLAIAYAGAQERYEMFAPSRMGVPRWLDIVYTPHKNKQGKVIGVIVHATDITKIKQTEISLRESEARSRALIEQAPVATCLFIGRDHTIEIANEMMLALWGKDRSVIGQALTDGVPELSNQALWNILEEVYATGHAYSQNGVPTILELYGQQRYFYFNFTYKPLFNDIGDVYGIIYMAVDITEQVAIREKIQESERRLRTLIQSAPPAIGMFVGPELIIESPNQTFKDTIGRGDDIEGKSLKDLMPELEQQPFLDLLGTVFKSGETFHTDSAMLQVMRNGILEEKYFNVTFSPLFNEFGNVYAIIDVSVDVTDTIRARKAIEVKEKELRDIISAAPIGICVVTDLPFIHVEEINDRFLLILGQHENAAVNVPTIFKQELERVLSSGAKHITEERAMKIIKDGVEQNIFVTFEYVPLADDNDAIRKVMIIAVEMTQQVNMRREIERVVAERTKELASSNINLQRSNYELEQFAYIASHDLQEPVRKINTFAGMLEGSLDSINEKSGTYIEKIKGSTQRMESLIKDVLSFSILSQNSGLATKVNLTLVIREAEAENELLIIKKQAVIECDNLPFVRAIHSQMLQLFSNLISNSLKYSREGIPPLVKITGATLKRSELKKYPQLLAHRTYLKITFSDNGIGFEKQHAERIFKIFQRLHGKNEYEGTGIGLSICQKIVHNHQGEIVASPGADGGAVFTIILPA